MFELSLLERIEAIGSPKSMLGKNPIEIEKRSIATHLARILNTHKGSVQIADDFGMPDMSVFSADGTEETMTKIGKAVLEVVKTYEKRLSNVNVTMETTQSDVLTIHFTIEGVLSRHQNVPVFFRSMMKPGGNIVIQ